MRKHTRSRVHADSRRPVLAAVEPIEQRLLMARYSFIPYIDSNGNNVRDGGNVITPGVLNEAEAYMKQPGRVSFWLDLNKNGKKETDEPYADGTPISSNTEIPTWFFDVSPGTYTIAWAQYPFMTGVTAAGTLDFTLASANSTLYTDLKLPSNLQTFTGRVFDDRNGSTYFDAGDVGLANQKVYADYNYNGVIDATDMVATTDANGVYTIKTKQQGFALRWLADPNYTLIRPAAGTTYYYGLNGSELYGNGTQFALGATTSTVTVIRGTVFEDTDTNGLKDWFDPALENFTVWADYDNDGVFDAEEPGATTDLAGLYSLSVDRRNPSLPVRMVLPAQYVQSAPAAGTTRIVNLTSNPAVVDGVNFGAYSPYDTIGGMIYIDANSNSNYDDGDPGAGSGHRIFDDTNRNLVWDAGENFVLTDSSGKFLFVHASTPGKTYYLVVSLINGLETASGQPIQITVTHSSTSTTPMHIPQQAYQLAVRRIAPPTGTATVSGAIFADANSNGRFDAGEATAANRTVFADYNYNRKYDAGEPIAVTDAAGAYSLTTRLTNISIRVVTLPDETVSLPYGATEIWLASVSGTASGKNLGIRTTPPPPTGPTIRGTVFADANGNGRHDANESKLAGRTVFADYNYNGRLDAGEASALTDATGLYSITTRDNNVSLRLVLGTGESVSLPYGATGLWFASVQGTLTGKNIGLSLIS